MAGLRESEWLAACISVGQAYGGDLEAVNVHTGLPPHTSSSALTSQWSPMDRATRHRNTMGLLRHLGR